MKLVQLLAKELKEWPEGATFIVQDENKNVWHLDKAHDLTCQDSEWTSKEWFYLVLVDGREILINSLASDNKTSKVTQEQWQAEREKMNKPKWIWHRGGWMPVSAATIVEVRLRCGDIQKHEACEFLWRHKDCDSAVNIMAYRIIEETKDQEIEEVKKTNFGTITYKLEIDATDANKEIDSLVAKWGQIESPLKWRDEIIELEAYEEEFRREREKLIRKLESEGFNLIDHAPAKCLLDEWEAMDYESFCVGDTVVCIHEKPDDTIAELTIGKEYRLILDDEQICVIDDIGDPMRYCIEIGCFKLVKRA